MKNRSAFTLIELSVVILIIGLIVAGTMKGVSMIRSSKLSTARSLSTKYSINSIKNLIAWYETSLINSIKPSENFDGAQITEWRDLSSGVSDDQKNKLTKAASNGLVLKLDGINSIPSMQFNGNTKLSLANFYQGSFAQATIFLVFRPSNSSSSTLLDSYNTLLSTYSISVSGNTFVLNAGNSAATSSIFTPNKDYVASVYFNGSLSKVFINDAKNPTNTIDLDAGSNLLNGLSIGASKNPNSFFTGLVSEVIIFNRILQIPERKAVMEYLSKKYKIRVSGL